MQTVHTAIWRRVNAPGHDACRLVSDEQGWSLDGTAVFLRDGDPAQLVYHLDGDPAWRTRRGTVRGFVGSRVVDVSIGRSDDGLWTMNGRVFTGLEDCAHLDYSFTPSTNLPHLRRITLAGQESADVPVAWLDLPLDTLARLPQRYSRRREATYWYEAPTVGYAAELAFAPTGFLHSYPGLWEAVG